MEAVMLAMMDRVSQMLNSRLEGLESRVLPQKRLAPASTTTEKRKESAPSKPAPAAAPATRPVPAANQEATKKAKRQTMAAAEAAASKATKVTQPQPTPQPTPGTTDPESWSAVVQKGGKTKRGNASKGPSGQVSAKKKKEKPIKLRPPKSSAVILTLQPGAKEKGTDYFKVLSQAQRSVNIREFGISGISMKVTVTGARMVVIPDDPNNEKAEAFAKRLRTVLDKDEVRVTRPTKCVSVRVSGLDDAATTAEIIAAVACTGECPSSEVKAGEIRRQKNGLGTTWVSCPIEAAKRITATGHILVGWVSAAVKIMRNRQMRCYKCLEEGHAAAMCTSKEDRSGLCFRCGKAGHKAKECTVEEAICLLCDAAKKPAAHRLGAKSCAATSTSRKRTTIKAKKAPKPTGK